ncbi:MAG: integrase arm-type DNA-binding domain-containing protein [Hyphomicrobiales bacterium]|nr:integrase arm-type DNA-binding domain-containing protein [Hyphomicrobiales bacterium]
MPSLTALKVAKAAHPGNRNGPFLLSDGLGLNLQIMPSGTKSWVLRYRFAGEARTLGLGRYGEGKDAASLAQARELAAEARAQVKKGIDPKRARELAAQAIKDKALHETSRTITFKQVAYEYLEAHEVSWRNAKHRSQWRSTLETYVFPIIGHMPIAEINAEAVEAVLKPIWQTIHETASRLRGRIEVILDYARAKGWRSTENPARWKESLKYRLPSLSRVKGTLHRPALPWAKLPEFIQELDAKGGIACKALIFCILTASRPGETRGATWSEFDLEKRVWTIPAVRMKALREHRVPLSEAAIKIIEQMAPYAGTKDSLVFPSSKAGAPLSDMTLSKIIRNMNEAVGAEPLPWIANDGRPVVVHGFRSTFRDWCEEATSTPRAVSESALAHALESKVEAAYNRTDHFEKRRVLMEEWGKYCTSNLS